MRKRGTEEGMAVERKESMSARTRVVGPVRPFSEGWWTERPQPRWSKERTSMPREASVGKRIPYVLPGRVSIASSVRQRTVVTCQELLTMIAEAVDEYQSSFSIAFSLQIKMNQCWTFPKVLQ